MITVYTNASGHISGQTLDKGQPPSSDAIWIDLVNPEEDERAAISKALNINLPTKTDMQAIEASSRLYAEGKTLFLTTDVVIGSDGPEPMVDVLLVSLTPSCLVTVRYCEPYAIKTFVSRITAQPQLFATTEDGLLAFLDSITDRIADILELLGQRVDDLSRDIFRRTSSKTVKEKQLQEILHNIGRAGDTTHKIRNSIGGMTRLVNFLGTHLVPTLNADQAATYQSLDRDITSLGEHAQFTEQEISFLLDATLGQINIEQNNIIKILSVVMVAFTPPTFFASMWGMNFHSMHEYDWPYGYAMALIVMLVSAVLPLLYFKRKKWM